MADQCDNTCDVVRLHRWSMMMLSLRPQIAGMCEEDAACLVRQKTCLVMAMYHWTHFVHYEHDNDDIVVASSDRWYV